jgi:sporulation protein YlmC with PRC-barrel domain
MAQTVAFVIGAEVTCTDGICGTLKRVVVDPVAEAVTHLVVEPTHRWGLGRLVPIELATTTDEGIKIAASIAEFERFNSAEETQFVPGTIGYAAYGPEQVLSWPYYGLEGGGISGDEAPGVSRTVTHDTIPAGEVEIRRGEPVYATDGAIGHVQGLVLDRPSHRVSHVLLQEGHLWGRKEVAIPISAVYDVEDGIRLRITKKEVSDLPPVQISH